jgi:ABC-type multidrug transport system fused ATPase/permease subunit
MIAVERLREIQSLKSEEESATEQAKLPMTAKGEVDFRDVEFGYVRGRPVLSHFDLRVSAGEWVAILGETGCGKTTLANLMLGFYRPTKGNIFFDGMSMREVSLQFLRRHVAIVFQDVGLMNGSVRDNLAMGNADLSLDQIRAAAKIACIDDFIMQLPERYEQNVGHLGALFSSGQRQRVAIARALLRDAPILVLDEATSNLDAETEQRVMQNIRCARQSRTTIVITHRLAAALLADIIVILERGTIKERGDMKNCWLWEGHIVSCGKHGRRVRHRQVKALLPMRTVVRVPVVVW